MTISCNQPPSYLDFTQRDQMYYKAFAKACELVRQHPGSAPIDGSKVSPDSVPLPDILRDLHPAYLRLSPQRIFISIGVGRGAYGIAWQRQEINPSVWELRTYAESLEKVLCVSQN
jgi:hypothetical protein